MNARKAANLAHVVHHIVVGDRRVDVGDEDLAGKIKTKGNINELRGWRPGRGQSYAA